MLFYFFDEPFSLLCSNTWLSRFVALTEFSVILLLDRHESRDMTKMISLRALWAGWMKTSENYGLFAPPRSCLYAASLLVKPKAGQTRTWPDQMSTAVLATLPNARLRYPGAYSAIFQSCRHYCSSVCIKFDPCKCLRWAFLKSWMAEVVTGEAFLKTQCFCFVLA